MKTASVYWKRCDSNCFIHKIDVNPIAYKGVAYKEPPVSCGRSSTQTYVCKNLWKIVKSVYSYSWFKHKIGFNPFTHRGMAY